MPRIVKYIVDHENSKLIIIYTHQNVTKETREFAIDDISPPVAVEGGFSYDIKIK